MESSFFSYFSKHGFNSISNPDLKVPEDNTLFFANSTMAKMKKRIANKDIPKEGYAIVQKCLRAWSLQVFLNKKEDFDFNSYFTMCGVLFPDQEPRNVLNHTVNFLVENGFELERIVIKTSRNLINVNKSIPEVINPTVLYDTEQENYYKWNYGMDEISGEGLTLSYNCEDGVIRDLGNIIAIKDVSGNITAWETGFGIETIIAIRDNIEQFNAHPIYNILNTEPNPDLKKIADSIVSSVEIIREGIAPGPKTQGYILRKFLTAIHYLNKETKLDVKETVLDYCKLMGYDESVEISNKITNYLDKIDKSKIKNLADFQRFMKKKLNSQSLVFLSKNLKLST